MNYKIVENVILADIVSYSQTPPNTDSRTLNDLVAYCARVSNPANQNNTTTNDRLIRYLMKHKHWSPFEMVSLCLKIVTTRDIARQILRHRSFSFQEFSQRYANVNDQDESFVLREARLQDLTNRQNSVRIDSDDKLIDNWYNHQIELIELAKQKYDWAIANGIAKEQARCVLPEGNTVSTMFMNGTLRSWIHYLELRLEEGTQLEHCQIAQCIAEAIKEVFPLNEI
jgi:thymidylate synthase (FAD)